MNLLTPQQLSDARQYRLLIALPHSDLGPFLTTYYFQRRTWIILAHYAFTTVLIIAWLLLGIAGHYSAGDWLRHFALAMLAFIALVPIHEGIHAVVYRALGARDVQMRGSLRRMYFYALAPDFVVDARGFAWVAVAPFLLITVALL